MTSESSPLKQTEVQISNPNGIITTNLAAQDDHSENNNHNNKYTKKQYLTIKKQANNLYKNGHFANALNYYNAILENYNTRFEVNAISNDEMSKLYSNKAMVYYCMGQQQTNIKDEYSKECLQSALKSIEYDENNIKGHYYAGKAYFNLQKYTESIKSYKNADLVAKKFSYNVGDELCSLLRQAQREKFREDERNRIEKFQNVEKLIEKIRPFLTEINKSSSSESESTADESHQGTDTVTDNRQQSDLKILEDFLNHAKQQCRRDPPPDALYGKISFELLQDPVITPSGVTYDRVNILEHLAKVGHFDPLTRQPLKSDNLVTNYALKEMIDDFISKNPWVEDDY